MSWGKKDRRIKLRTALRQRDGDDCHICRKPMAFGVHPDRPDFATIDHVIPRSQGGRHHMNNLKLAHRRCNLARSDSAIPGQANGLSPQ